MKLLRRCPVLTVAIALPALLAACAHQAVPDGPAAGDHHVAVQVLMDQGVVSDTDPDAVGLVVVEALSAPASARADVHVALVLDTSGSMDGHRMDNAREAAHAFVDALRDGDRLTLVSFGDAAEVGVSCLRLRRNRDEVHEVIDALEAEGNTCTSCGLEAAYAAMIECGDATLSRAILFSDGHANRGTSDPASLAWMAQEMRAYHGFETSTIGLGRLHDEAALASLATAGAADYHFLPASDALARVLADELHDIHATTVTNVQLAIRPGDGGALAGTPMVGFSLRGDEMLFDLGQLAIGETREFLVQLALPPGEPGRALQAQLVFSDTRGNVWESRASARVERSLDAGEVEESINARVVEAFLALQTAAAVEAAIRDAQQREEREEREIERRLLEEHLALEQYQQQMQTEQAPIAWDDAAFETLEESVAGGASDAPAEVRAEALRSHAIRHDQRRGRPAARPEYAPERIPASAIE